MAAFADLGLLSGMGTSSIENEIGILKSRRMMANVVKALNINVQYFDDSGVPVKELYTDSPYLIQILQLNEQQLENRSEEQGSTYRIRKLGDKLQLINVETEDVIKAEEGAPVNLGFADIVINKNEEGIAPGEAEVLVHFSTVDAVASVYREKLQVNLTDKNSSLIELSLQDPDKPKARDILDQLVLEYNREAIEDKNLVARNTAKFIDERLGIINEELDSVETGKEEFKEANKLNEY